MIYGATGYTGRLVCEYAKSLGLIFVIGGRTERNIRELASSLEVACDVFELENAEKVDSSLVSIQLVLNCAGPFIRTAKPLINACIRNGVHYLDISAELESYKLAEERTMDAARANVMLMPGCGGSIAMLGCLAGHALKNIKTVSSIDIALCVAGSMSRGSATSATESSMTNCLQRSNGKLAPHDVKYTKRFDFDNGIGEVDCFPVTLPDLITIWKSTGIGNIRTYAYVSGDAFPTGNLEALPNGPSAEQRKATPYHAAVTLTTVDGIVKKEVLHTVNGYTFTSLASVHAARLVLGGKYQPGFQTPAGIFGPEFVQTVSGSRIVEL